MSFLAVGVAGAVAVGGAVASSAIQAGAAKKAAETQAESADEALALQREQWQQAREDLAPWREAGMRGLSQMQAMARHGPPRMAPFTAPGTLDPSQFAFTPPTAEDLARDPSYQFRLQEGQRALERSASARGGLLGGGFARGLERYAQDYASTEYGNVYNRAMGENQVRYGRALTANEARMQRALQQYQTRYNAGMGRWQARMQPWQALAFGGQQATQNLNQLGGEYAARGGELLTSQGAALAGGQMGAANAWSQGIQQVGNIGLQGLGAYYMGRQMQPPQAPTPAYNPNTAPYDPWEFMGQ